MILTKSKKSDKKLKGTIKLENVDEKIKEDYQKF